MYLQGVNFGGFLSQADLNEEHLKTFITEKDFKVVKAWGFNIVRLPVDYMLFERDDKPYVYDENRLKYLDNCVNWAEKNGLWLMIDLHKSPGHTFAKERDANDIWGKESASRKRFIKIWEFLAARYAGRGDKIMYELLNEPVADKDAKWNALATDGLKAIRKFDKKHWVVIESNRWGNVHTMNNLKVFKNDKKIIYSFHFYEPIVVTHQMAEWTGFVRNNIYKKLVEYPGQPEGMKEAGKEVEKTENDFAIFFKNMDKYWDKHGIEKLVQMALDFKKKNKVPVLCGEFGCVAHASVKTRENWTKDFISILKKNKISYTYWNYKNMDFGIWDYSEKYAKSPNYANKQRLDKPILKALQSGIL